MIIKKKNYNKFVTIGTPLRLTPATNSYMLPHVGEQSVLIRSTVRSISLAPVTHYRFPFIQAYALFLCRYVICGLSYHVC